MYNGALWGLDIMDIMEGGGVVMGWLSHVYFILTYLTQDEDGEEE